MQILWTTKMDREGYLLPNRIDNYNYRFSFFWILIDLIIAIVTTEIRVRDISGHFLSYVTYVTYVRYLQS